MRYGEERFRGERRRALLFTTGDIGLIVRIVRRRIPQGAWRMGRKKDDIMVGHDTVMPVILYLCSLAKPMQI